MREMERHPQIMHLPAPHIWQVFPISESPFSTKQNMSSVSLVVTLELHVKEDLSDEEVLALTHWAQDKCVSALGGSKNDLGDPTVEVTVGVVKG